MKPRVRPLFAAALAALLLAFAASAWFLWVGIQSFQAGAREEGMLLADLKVRYARNPFASLTNVAAVQAQAERVAGWKRSLTALLAEGFAEPSGEVKSTDFIDRLVQGRREWLDLARERGVTMDKDFAFGFENQSSPPEAAAVPALLRQLALTDAICRKLFEARIASLTEIECRLEPLPESAAPVPGVPVPPALYETLRFKVGFRARELQTWDALRALTRGSPFLSLRSVSLQRESDDVRGVEIAAPRSGDAASADAEPPPPPEKRIVSGPAVETPMKITLELDAFLFRAEAGS
jgi:hypothetical protein